MIPLDFDESEAMLNVSSLAQYLWVDQKTRTVEIRLITYNGNEEFFAIVSLSILFAGRAFSFVVSRF